MNSLILWVICGGLTLLGIILFFILVWRRQTRFERNQNINHYQEIRDEIILKEENENKEPIEVNKIGDIIRVIGRMVGLILSLYVFSQILATFEVAVTGLPDEQYCLDLINWTKVLLPIVAILAAFEIIARAFGLIKQDIKEEEEENKKISRKRKRKAKKMNKDIEHYTEIRDKMVKKRLGFQKEEIVEMED